MAVRVRAWRRPPVGARRAWGSEICSSYGGGLVVLVEDTAEAVVSADVAGRGVLHQLWFVCALRPERLDETVTQVRREFAPYWTR